MRFPEYLKEQLDTYMSQFPKVRIIRLKERQGLIRARLAGAAAATGSSPSAQLFVCVLCGTLHLQMKELKMIVVQFEVLQVQLKEEDEVKFQQFPHEILNI